jgi:Na+/H+ antiporter NhaD/arsenite permease-like protein
MERAQNWGRIALWALGMYGVLLAASTITHQPDYATDFPSYANYVTTQQFLLSHLIGSIAGAAFGLIGGAALLVLAAQFAPQLAGWGFVTWTFAQVGAGVGLRGGRVLPAGDRAVVPPWGRRRRDSD